MILITENQQDYAIDQLQFLLKIEGELKIVTSTPSRNHDFLGQWHPYAYEVHDVIRLEGPDQKGRYIAYSREGDYCIGAPSDLIVKLLEHKRWAMKGKIVKDSNKIYAPSLKTRVNNGGDND